MSHLQTDARTHNTVGQQCLELFRLLASSFMFEKGLNTVYQFSRNNPVKQNYRISINVKIQVWSSPCNTGLYRWILPLSLPSRNKNLQISSQKLSVTYFITSKTFPFLQDKAYNCAIPSFRRGLPCVVLRSYSKPFSKLFISQRFFSRLYDSPVQAKLTTLSVALESPLGPRDKYSTVKVSQIFFGRCFECTKGPVAEPKQW